MNAQIFGSEKSLPSYDEFRVQYNKYSHEIYSIYAVYQPIFWILIILDVERCIPQR
jgi:hypothetical protein